jgi:MSHA biogenesis protein MshN
MKSGRVIEASDLLQQGLVLVPGHLAFAKLEARLLLEQNQLQQAVRVLEKHQPASLMPLDYHAFMAALYQRNKQHAQAIEKYRKLLDAKPAAGVWRIGLAISLEAAGQQPEAMQAYLQAKNNGNLTTGLLRYANNRLSILKQSGYKLPQATE